MFFSVKYNKKIPPLKRGTKEKNYEHSYFHTLKGHNGCVSIILTEDQAVKFGKDGSLWEIGFLPSEKITGYYCNKCKSSYEYSPEICVFIRREKEGFFVELFYKCKECKKVLFFSDLQSPEGIDPKYIVLDETGDYVIPT